MEIFGQRNPDKPARFCHNQNEAALCFVTINVSLRNPFGLGITRDTMTLSLEVTNAGHAPFGQLIVYLLAASSFFANDLAPWASLTNSDR